MDDDAVSVWDLLGDPPEGGGQLPGWYMPAPAVGTRRVRGWRRRAAIVVVASFAAVAGSGLCATYGHVGIG